MGDCDWFGCKGKYEEDEPSEYIQEPIEKLNKGNGICILCKYCYLNNLCLGSTREKNSCKNPLDWDVHINRECYRFRLVNNWKEKYDEFGIIEKKYDEFGFLEDKKLIKFNANWHRDSKRKYCLDKNCKGKLLESVYFDELKCSKCGKYWKPIIKFVEASKPDWEQK